MLGIYSVVEVESYGWLSAHTLGLGALASALLAAFVVRQATAATLSCRCGYSAHAVSPEPIWSRSSWWPRCSRSRSSSRCTCNGSSVTEPPPPASPCCRMAAVIGAVSLGLSARLSARFGDRSVLLLGLALLIGMLGLLTRLPVHAHYATDLLPVMFLAAGFGLALPALTALGMSGAGEEDAGLASGLFNTTQQIGMAMGVAVLSTLAASRTDTLLAAGGSRAEALTGGYHLAFAVGTGLLATAFLVALAVLGRPDRAPAA